MEMLFRLNSVCPMFDSFRTWEAARLPASALMLQKQGPPVRGSSETPALQRRVGQWTVRPGALHGSIARGGVMHPTIGAAGVRQRGTREGDDHESKQKEPELFHGPLLVRAATFLSIGGNWVERKRWRRS